MELMIITILGAIFLSINMGASGFSISFAPTYGSGLLTRKQAALLFTIFVAIGATIIGNKVVTTLTEKLVLSYSSPISGLLIIIAATITMFTTNILKVPQSTSFVIVGAFTGSGIFYGKFNVIKLGEIFIYAIIFSVIAYFLTFSIMKQIYPLRKSNFHIFENIMSSRNKLRKFILFHDCYSAFAVGSNNVANVVAPLVIMGIGGSHHLLLFLFAPLFGLGGLILGKGVINTLSKEIIPIGEISAGIVSLVTSTFVILASLLGLPTPYVQFSTFAILGISAVKDGLRVTSQKIVVKKIFLVWLAVPFITALISYLLHFIFIK